ncbi:FkbM family methyltransferase [Nitratidesulfovibrio sp. SRB-5]|uniref:FkbM family methyltransferase n=1 Tax=Nitratidesulfovibrio sp. SRB-5 TaxID=2872636 RepID=UPI0010275ED4|nr:FkbM family methyltransferase [Nitratidesulfovibrio sp. SRB-5]MBZ2170878.1 FkbM family methyltransferase [Nitratidesulfovibrio sp. SRB-5]RXF78124.1 FkbM family methyltransferase [Desulfovibrio sp. DS-1]
MFVVLLKNRLKEIIRKSNLCRKIAEIYDLFPYRMIHYGQNAEDIIAGSLFPASYTGFYVDIGAHHPVKFSNTYLLYQAGWQGINIDPLPGSMTLFNKMRPKDVNLEICVSDDDADVEYYIFSEPAYNTISKKRAEHVISRSYSQLIETKAIKTESLKAIFSRHIPKGQSIDLMTIDVETMELQVLKTNDWERYIPRVIVIESLASFEKDIFSIIHDPAISYLIEQDYRIIGKAINAVYLQHGK